MTVEEARAVLEPLVHPGEGWLDAVARRERNGLTLTDLERAAADVLWDEVIKSMKAVAAAADKPL